MSYIYNHVSVVFSFEEDTIAWYYNGWTSRITKLVMNSDFLSVGFFVISYVYVCVISNQYYKWVSLVFCFNSITRLAGVKAC